MSMTSLLIPSPSRLSATFALPFPHSSSSSRSLKRPLILPSYSPPPSPPYCNCTSSSPLLSHTSLMSSSSQRFSTLLLSPLPPLSSPALLTPSLRLTLQLHPHSQTALASPLPLALPRAKASFLASSFRSHPRRPRCSSASQGVITNLSGALIRQQWTVWMLPLRMNLPWSLPVCLCRSRTTSASGRSGPPSS